MSWTNRKSSRTTCCVRKTCEASSLKEIGGYLEFEHLGGREYYPGLLKLNLGRTAIAWYLTSAGCRTVYVPRYLCESVTDAIRLAGIRMIPYSVDERLVPQLPAEIAGKKLPPDTFLFLLNSYGQLTGKSVLRYKEIYGNLLADYTQAFFQRPSENVPTVYSVRKYFGVTDGAYLSSDRPLPLPEKQDESHARYGHVLGRFEEPASAFYQAMLDNAHSYEGASVSRMSALTENLLGGLDYTEIAGKRNRNFLALHEKLAGRNLLYTEQLFTVPEAPFAYPFYAEDGRAIRRKLAEKKIYVPTYWSNVISENEPDTVEYRYAAGILPLPCDQRYGPSEMEAVSSAVLEILKGDSL